MKTTGAAGTPARDHRSTSYKASELAFFLGSGTAEEESRHVCAGVLAQALVITAHGWEAVARFGSPRAKSVPALAGAYGP